MSTDKTAEVAAPLKPSTGESWDGRELVRSLALLAAFVLAIYGVARALLPANTFLSQSEEEQMTASLKAKVPSYVSAAFRTFHGELPPRSGDMAPTLVFDGAHAEVLNTEAPEVDTVNVFGRRIFRSSVLARTAEGRYFEVFYTFDLRDLRACVQAPSDCLAQDSARLSLDRNGAMRSYFNANNFDAARFQQIFGEAPPPHKMPA